MILLRQPSARKLEKLFRNEDFTDKTILHYTGGMFGIGCKASSRGAIDRIQKLKQRSGKEGLILLAPHIDWFAIQGIHVPDRLRPLLDQYWPGNLTVVFPCRDERFAHLAVQGKVAFRVPEDELLRVVIELLDDALVSTSVNLSTLPPENDLNRLTGFYKHWFDYGILPGAMRAGYDPQPSTVVEFVASHEETNHSGFDELKCLREGSIPFHGVKGSFEVPTIMFVCTANICRSPIADKLFNHYSVQAGLALAGDSCGLMSGGQSISAGSLQLLLEKGIEEARDHVSKQVTPEMISGSRLVLTMEARQRDFLREKEPTLQHKILTLNEYLGEPGDIEDPFGSDLNYYRKTYDIIDDRIQRLVKKLAEPSGIKGT
ncbi:MAG: Sua5/YciO/YrdC/YwlC family protein [Candidatus Syntrophosphaera sp.]|nr:Sua5/YciO/YrdC/YwlC family protein [Candidatus Syntrophosphaera sp.]